MDNIRIGKRDASDEEVLRVARLAQCVNSSAKGPRLPDHYRGKRGNPVRWRTPAYLYRPRPAERRPDRPA